MKTSWIPEGYTIVAPYLIVPDVDALIAFLQSTFDAELKERMVGPDGRVGHAEVRIGDGLIMMGGSTDQFPPMQGMVHIYCEDTDAAYRRALDAGAESVMEPADQFYGARSAGVKDASGNVWWIATQIETVSPEEMERRSAEPGNWKA